MNKRSDLSKPYSWGSDSWGTGIQVSSVVHTCHSAHLEVRGQLEGVISFNHVSLGGKCLCLLSHLAGSREIPLMCVRSYCASLFITLHCLLIFLRVSVRIWPTFLALTPCCLSLLQDSSVLELWKACANSLSLATLFPQCSYVHGFPLSETPQ